MRLAAVNDFEVADRYRPFEDTPDADVPVVEVVDEDANSGLETLEWLAPLAATACAHIAIRPRVLPGTGLIISEQYIVVDAVSRRIVLPFLDVEEVIEFFWRLQAEEIWIMRDPVRWSLHLTFPIINCALQAENRSMITIERGIYACRVISSFPG